MTVHHGDCLDVMPTLDAESFDAIVTDPPYGLGFMGKYWDHGVPGAHFWTEALRVAKPGAHLVAFGGTRTYHRLTCAIEDAGWEIRDCLSWLYGSGFPKSHNVSKAIDKVNGETDRLHRFTAWMRTTGLTTRQLDDVTGTAMGGHYLTAKSQPAIPTPELWARIRPLVAHVPSWVDVLVGRIAAEREVVGRNERPAGWFTSCDGHDITVSSTDAAKQWEGWGTALKPAWEPIILARKPLSGTVAANVQEHGTGALNIDGCRIGSERIQSHYTAMLAYGGENGRPWHEGHKTNTHEHTGRWPANVVLDEDAARLLDEQSGERPGMPRTTARVGKKAGAMFNPGDDDASRSPGFGDSGGASRFFYTAKASRAERNAGLDGMAEVRVKQSGHVDQRVWDIPGSHAKPRANHHPTVKPLDLMQWLCRLVTPKGGLILDPFCGSGTTGRAAVAEGFRFVGIEKEAEYVEIARARIAEYAPLFGGVA